DVPAGSVGRLFHLLRRTSATLCSVDVITTLRSCDPDLTFVPESPPVDEILIVGVAARTLSTIADGRAALELAMAARQAISGTGKPARASCPTPSTSPAGPSSLLVLPGCSDKSTPGLSSAPARRSSSPTSIGT